MTVARFLGAFRVSFVIVFPILALMGLAVLAREIDVPVFARGTGLPADFLYYGLLSLLIVALTIALSAKLVERRWGLDTGTTIAAYLPLNVWKLLPDDVAEAEWRRAGAYPRGGTVERAWTIPDTPLHRFAGVDASGERFALLAGPPEMLTTPSPVWVGGLLLRAFKDRAGTIHRSLALFDRLDVHWDRLPTRLGAEHVRWLGEDDSRVLGIWLGRGTPTSRVDCQTTDGRVVVAMRDVPEAPEPQYLAGLLLVYSRTLYAPDEVSEPAAVGAAT